jgi:asparagine synthase (glutamine-hydrolysing)
LAASEVKVVLSGDGGDELFGGYNTYQAHKMARWYKRLPKSLRNIINTGMASFPSSVDQHSLVFRAKKFARGVEYEPEWANYIWWGAYLPEEYKQLLVSDVSNQLVSNHGYEPIQNYLSDIKDLQGLNRIFYLDLKIYLQDDMLVKVDRMSMANSLEVRVPFLAGNVVDLACRLPEEYKIKGLKTKYLLRKAMKPFLPETIRKRGKRGFDLPLGHWLRHEMREILEDTLRARSINGSELFNKNYIERLLQEHMSGKRNHRQLLYPLFVFLSWCNVHRPQVND